MLHLHRGERSDVLVEPLASLLSRPRPDPFALDVVAVPTRGVERWLAQRLSHRLGAGPDGEAGVCAGVCFDSPSRLTQTCLARVLGVEPEDDPWRGERLVWTLLDVVDECAGQPWCAALGRHLGIGETGFDAETGIDGEDGIGEAGIDGEDGIDGSGRHRLGRRLGVSRHLATLFTSYGVQRPQLLRCWAQGLDDDGAGGRVPADLDWQRVLWRRLRDRIGAPSPAERLDDAVRAVVREPGVVDLPPLLSVFGATRLPAEQLAVLHALSRHREVHLWLPHPSPALWDAVTAAAAAGRPAAARRRDRVRVAAHPLLASMARDATELQVRLTALDGTTVTHHPAPEPPPGLLGALQRSLRLDAPEGRHRLAATDRSVEVHACHGRTRQVEVLRDLLVGLFAADPTLQPRDVVVMCPDIEALAPLVGAVFGLAGPELASGAPAEVVHPGQRLRVRLADRSLRQTNPQLSLLSTLLELADGRVTASEVLDLAATPPVRRRFRFDDAELDRLRAWAVAAGAHWGEDAARRARFGLGDVRQGTWEVALDRVLLGAAMAEEGQRFLASALPLDDVGSTEIDLAGRLAEFLDRLTVVLAGLAGVRPLEAWLQVLEQALELLADAGAQDAWQGVQARQVLADVGAGAADPGGSRLRLADVRVLLAGHLRGRPTRAGFRTGALTVCSLEPMRAVPHRVVCLLGLDDGAFPRLGSSDGDDVLLREPCLGERDRRSEDRQLFLDAVSAAGEHLVVLYTGADERTGALRPPAVPVAELLDALDRVAAAPDGRPVREHVVVRHPLQGIDERAFTPGALHRPGPFSFDALAYRAALAARGRRGEAQSFLPAELPPEPRPDPVDLEDLVAMLEHPVRWFLRNRLGMWLPDTPDDVEDRLPLKADGLASWAVGDRVLAAALDGVDPWAACLAEWRRGTVPPKELGRAELLKICRAVGPLVSATGRYAVGPAGSLDVSVALPGGSTLTGTVGGVHGDTVVRSVYSRLAAKHRLRAWVQLLAVAAARPRRRWLAVTVGRDSGPRSGARVMALTAPPADDARGLLEQLVALRDRAWCAPLPMPVATTAAYASERLGHNVPGAALEYAAEKWSPKNKNFGFGEQGDLAHVLVWGERARLRDVAGEPDPAERAWGPEEVTRLGALAVRVWRPLLECEETR